MAIILFILLNHFYIKCSHNAQFSHKGLFSNNIKTPVKLMEQAGNYDVTALNKYVNVALINF